MKTTAGARTYNLELAGSLSIHGRTRRIEVPARVTYLTESEQTRMRVPGNLTAGRTSFDVAQGLRSPWDAGRVGAKVAETIKIDVSFFATDKNPATM